MKAVKTNIATVTRGQYAGWFYQVYNGGASTEIVTGFASRKAALEALKKVAPTAELLKVKDFNRESDYGSYIAIKNSTVWHQNCN